MRPLFLMTLGAMLVLAVSSTRLSAVEPANPELGTWDFNPTKSTSTRRLAKSAMRTYERKGDAIKMTGEVVSQEGVRSEIGYTARYDGRDYPITGSADYTIAFTRTGPLSVEGIQKSGGKVVNTFTRVISGDGKLLTLTIQGTNPKGEPFKHVLVFEKRSP